MATFIWVLNYTFTYLDHWNMLQCTVRVVNNVAQRQYVTQDTERLHICGV